MKNDIQLFNPKFGINQSVFYVESSLIKQAYIKSISQNLDGEIYYGFLSSPQGIAEKNVFVSKIEATLSTFGNLQQRKKNLLKELKDIKRLEKQSKNK